MVEAPSLQPSRFAILASPRASCQRPDERRSPRLEPHGVLELRRDPVEARKKVAVVATEPAPGHHEEEVVARLQGPPEPALEAEEPRLAVVLDEVRPGPVRGEVVAEAARVELRD